MIDLPPLLQLRNEDDFETHFQQTYLMSESIYTFDGIEVLFFERNFNHAFYTKSDRNSIKKDMFSLERAQRMDWIKAVLKSSEFELYRRIMRNGIIRRIALVPSERYAVIIQVEKNMKRANFVTAYVVESDVALGKMRSNPKW